MNITDEVREKGILNYVRYLTLTDFPNNGRENDDFADLETTVRNFDKTKLIYAFYEDSEENPALIDLPEFEGDKFVFGEFTVTLIRTRNFLILNIYNEVGIIGLVGFFIGTVIE